MNAPIFSQRATSFQPSAGVRTGCSSGRRRKPPAVPSRASTAQSSSAQLPNARSRVDLAQQQRPRHAIAARTAPRPARPPRARAARPAPPSRDRAPPACCRAAGRRTAGRRSRSPAAGAPAGASSQYCAASAASACGGRAAHASDRPAPRRAGAVARSGRGVQRPRVRQRERRPPTSSRRGFVQRARHCSAGLSEDATQLFWSLLVESFLPSFLAWPACRTSPTFRGPSCRRRHRWPPPRTRTPRALPRARASS